MIPWQKNEKDSLIEAEVMEEIYQKKDNEYIVTV